MAMKYPVRVLMVLVAMFAWPALARVADHADQWNGAEINWRDARTGISESAKTGRTALIVFHATWCTACRQYRSVFSDPEVVAASRDFVMILLDADKEKELNGALSPDGTYVPRTLFVTPKGDVLSDIVGNDPTYPHSIDIKSPAELIALMRKAREKYGTPGSTPAPQLDDRT